MKYSFVIPCYKCSLTIASVINEISTTMQKHQESDYEIICVNDFPKDNTFDVLKSLAQNNHKLRVINLSRNFGQHSALLAGYHYAHGDIVISMDDDGQTPADEVFNLIEKIDEGYDVVFARYSNKKHSLFRNFGSKINDYMAEILIDKPKNLYVSSYFAAKKYIIKEVTKYDNCYPYVTGLVLRTTSFITNVDINHRNRELGNSNYSIKSLFSLWLNGFTAFSVKPLRISMIFGLICAAGGFLLTLYSIINKFLNPLVPIGWTSMIAAISIIGGVILIMLGIIGEYVGRSYISMNNNPQYIVKEYFEENQSNK